MHARAHAPRARLGEQAALAPDAGRTLAAPPIEAQRVRPQAAIVAGERKMRTAWILAFAGCGADTSTSSVTGSSDSDSESCDAARADQLAIVNDYVAAHVTCEAPADCQLAGGLCELFYGPCAVAMNTTLDAEEYEALYQQAQAALGEAGCSPMFYYCDCAAEEPFVADCVAGQCVAAPY